MVPKRPATKCTELGRASSGEFGPVASHFFVVPYCRDIWEVLRIKMMEMSWKDGEIDPSQSYTGDEEEIGKLF
jgi:hypothetical protein